MMRLAMCTAATRPDSLLFYLLVTQRPLSAAVLSLLFLQSLFRHRRVDRKCDFVT